MSENAVVLQKLDRRLSISRSDALSESVKRRRTRVFNTKKNPPKPRFPQLRQNRFISNNVVTPGLNKPSRIPRQLPLEDLLGHLSWAIPRTKVVIRKPDELTAK